MTDIRELSIKAAAIKAVADAVKLAGDETRAAIADHLDAGDRKHAKIGEDSVATISFSTSSATAKVTDPEAFLGWVVRNRPDQLRRRVTVSAYDLGVILHPEGYMEGARDEAHERLTRAVDASTLEVEPGYTTTVLANAVRNKAAVDTATGEMIPGVEYVPGGQPGSISVRQSDDQRTALMDAYNRGDLDLLALATTPLELEPAK